MQKPKDNPIDLMPLLEKVTAIRLEGSQLFQKAQEIEVGLIQAIASDDWEVSFEDKFENIEFHMAEIKKALESIYKV